MRPSKGGRRARTQQSLMRTRRRRTVSGQACEDGAARSTDTAVGTTPIPYLRARSGRALTSTVITVLPCSRNVRSSVWQSEQSGCVNSTTASATSGSVRSAGSIDRRSRWPIPRRRARQPVHLAAGAEAGRRRQQREGGNQRAEHRAQQREAGQVGDRGGGQHDQPDHVGGAGRTRVLERPLAEPRLHQLEVGDAGQAPAAAEAQAQRQLQRQQREQRPEPGDHRDQRARRRSPSGWRAEPGRR